MTNRSPWCPGPLCAALLLALTGLGGGCGDDSESSGEGEGEPEGQVVVNEVLAKDAEDGPDWVELYNAGTAPVSLVGWGLSDDEEDLFRFTFPEGFEPLAPKAFLVIEGKGSLEPLSFDFGFSKGERVVLSRPDGSEADRADWEDGDAEEGTTYGRLPDGTGEFTTVAPTRGAANRALD